MKNILVTILSLAALLMSPVLSEAKDGCVGDCASCHKLTEKEALELLKKTGGTVRSIKPAPIAGMFELLMDKDGKQGLIYIDYAKKRLMQGFIINIEDLRPMASHSDEMPNFRQAAKPLDPKTIPIEHALVMGNPQGSKKLYIFTDPDCPYCRKLHVELKKLEKLEPDVAIYVLLYPLPMHPKAYEKSRSAIFQKKRNLLDKIFDGLEIISPVRDQGKAELEEIIRYANRNNISATPTIVLQDGRMVSGFRDVDELKKLLEGQKL